jgi:hypothetical protein
MKLLSLALFMISLFQKMPDLDENRFQRYLSSQLEYYCLKEGSDPLFKKLVTHSQLVHQLFL